MTEPAQLHPAPQDEPGFRSWDASTIADALAVPAESRVDQVHGEGTRYCLGQPPTTELEIFPATGAVRVTAPNLALYLLHQEPPLLSPSTVVFTAKANPECQRLVVSADGFMSLVFQPHSSGHERVALPPVVPEHPIPQTDTSQPRSDDPTPPQGGSEMAITTPEDQATRERVHLAGRLGTDIRFRTTRNGALVASFPLAIKQDDGSTQWRDVLVFNARAEKLRASEPLQKGQSCEIVGYRHQKEVMGKDGTSRTIEEVYAVVVKPR